MYHWQISDNTTLYRPSTLSFVITDSPVKKITEGGGRDVAFVWFEIGRQRHHTHIEPFTPQTHMYSKRSVNSKGHLLLHLVFLSQSFLLFSTSLDNSDTLLKAKEE